MDFVNAPDCICAQPQYTVYMNSVLMHLKNRRLIWQGHQSSDDQQHHWHSGFEPLDELLHGGWPNDGVVLLQSDCGIGELRLLLPALQQRQQQQQRLLALIAPPYQLNGEPLAACGLDLSQILLIQPATSHQALWSAEQCLKSGCCYAALLWHDALEIPQLKRLQLAAQQGQAVQFILRQSSALLNALPLQLSLQLQAQPQGIGVTVHKQRGQRSGRQTMVNMQRHWPQLCMPQPADNVVRLHQQKAG